MPFARGILDNASSRLLRRERGNRLPTLKQTLKEAREEKMKWGLREAARRTGIHNAHLSQIESGVIARPDPNILFTLATAYGLDYDDPPTTGRPHPTDTDRGTKFALWGGRLEGPERDGRGRAA